MKLCLTVVIIAFSALLSITAKDAALIVGINEYQHYPPIGQLPYTNDVSLFAAALDQVSGRNLDSNSVVVLTGKSATRDAIVDAIDKLSVDGRSCDTLYLYFSGHGASDPGDGVIYLMTYDSDPRSPSKRGYQAEAFVIKAINSIKPRRACVFIDACNAGAAARDQFAGRDLEYGIHKINGKSPELICFFATPNGAQAFGNLQSGCSWFTYFLTRGLQGEADANSNEVVSAIELYDYIKKQIHSCTGLTDIQKRAQVPQTNATFNKSAALARVTRHRIRYLSKPAEMSQVRAFHSVVTSENSDWFYSNYALSSDLHRLALNDQSRAKSLQFLKVFDFRTDECTIVNKLEPIQSGLWFCDDGSLTAVSWEGASQIGLSNLRHDSNWKSQQLKKFSCARKEPILASFSQYREFVISTPSTTGKSPKVSISQELQFGNSVTGAVSWTNRCGSNLVALALSATGDSVACGFKDKVVLMYNRGDTNKPATFKTAAPVRQLAFGPDNFLLLLAEDGLYEVASPTNRLIASVDWSEFAIGESGKVWGHENTKARIAFEELDLKSGIKEREIVAAADVKQYFLDPRGIVLISSFTSIQSVLNQQRRVEVLQYP